LIGSIVFSVSACPPSRAAQARRGVGPSGPEAGKAKNPEDLVDPVQVRYRNSDV